MLFHLVWQSLSFNYIIIFNVGVDIIWLIFTSLLFFLLFIRSFLILSFYLDFIWNWVYFSVLFIFTIGLLVISLWFFSGTVGFKISIFITTHLQIVLCYFMYNKRLNDILSIFHFHVLCYYCHINHILIL